MGERPDPALRGRVPAPDCTFLAGEREAPWEYDAPREGDTTSVRWRTLVS
jgi:hypothetical protein